MQLSQRLSSAFAPCAQSLFYCTVCFLCVGCVGRLLLAAWPMGSYSRGSALQRAAWLLASNNALGWLRGLPLWGRVWDLSAPCPIALWDLPSVLSRSVGRAFLFSAFCLWAIACVTGYRGLVCWVDPGGQHGPGRSGAIRRSAGVGRRPFGVGANTAVFSPGGSCVPWPFLG